MNTLPAPGELLSNWRDDQIGASIDVHCIEGYGYRLTLHDRFHFAVSSSGREVLGESHPISGRSDWNYQLVNHVLPMVATLRHRLILHASAVEVGGRAWIFTGNSGYGKSTLATAIAMRYGKLVGDDCLMLEEIDGTWHATANYPSLRLWPENATALLGDEGEQGRDVSSYCRKKNFFQGGNQRVAIHCEPVPIQRVFCLVAPSETPGEASVVAGQLTPAVRVQEVLGSLFRLDVSDPFLKYEFQLATRFVSRVDIQSLQYPRSYRDLPSVCDQIRRIPGK